MTKVLIVSASKGIGLETLKHALSAGYAVRAFMPNGQLNGSLVVHTVDGKLISVAFVDVLFAAFAAELASGHPAFCGETGAWGTGALALEA